MTQSIIDIKPAKNERLYAVGDLHGCYDELLALEQKIQVALRRAKIKNCRIISVGDLCDRGPDSNKVIEHFVQGKALGTHELILGNHETFFLLALGGLRPDLIKKAGIKQQWFDEVLNRVFRQLGSQVDSWQANGGASVFKSYGASIDDINTWDKIPLSHIKLIFEAPLAIRTPKAIVTHALIHHGDIEVLADRDKGLRETDQSVDEAVVRCLWERLPSLIRIDSERRHVSGHTPLEAVLRSSKLATVQIDTGAVYGRALTALDIHNFRTVSVKSGFNCRP